MEPVESVPMRAGVDAGVALVMTGHVRTAGSRRHGPVVGAEPAPWSPICCADLAEMAAPA